MSMVFNRVYIKNKLKRDERLTKMQDILKMIACSNCGHEHYFELDQLPGGQEHCEYCEVCFERLKIKPLKETSS